MPYAPAFTVQFVMNTEAAGGRLSGAAVALALLLKAMLLRFEPWIVTRGSAAGVAAKLLGMIDVSDGAFAMKVKAVVFAVPWPMGPLPFVGSDSVRLHTTGNTVPSVGCGTEKVAIVFASRFPFDGAGAAGTKVPTALMAPF